jgi:erythromycin esterase
MNTILSAGTYSLSDSKDLNPLMERIGDSRIVLLGEASHGTHEYYTWRTAISKRLIVEKGFHFIAVEGDWPDCYRINRYIKGYERQDQNAHEVLKEFKRWPTWMWANWEIAALVSWMKNYNLNKHQKVGFYGLDVYSLWESMEALMDYLKKNDPYAAGIAEKAMACFQANNRDEQHYAVRALSESCRDEVVDLLKTVRHRVTLYNHDPEAMLNTVQNAHVAVDAERYYRNMVAFNDNTWNIRDKHMMDTLDRLLEFHGQDTKAIVWEHNTHVGDARYTDMKKSGMFNIGQLAREQYRKEVTIIGFGSYQGKVIAGTAWNAPMQEMNVPEGRLGSLEQKLHEESAQDRLLIFDQKKEKKQLQGILPHRAIGVVYNPLRENGNYVPSDVSHRYDAFIYLDQTTALHPLALQADSSQVPETYPFEF